MHLLTVLLISSYRTTLFVGHCMFLVCIQAGYRLELARWRILFFNRIDYFSASTFLHSRLPARTPSIGKKFDRKFDSGWNLPNLLHYHLKTKGIFSKSHTPILNLKWRSPGKPNSSMHAVYSLTNHLDYSYQMYQNLLNTPSRKTFATKFHKIIRQSQTINEMQSTHFRQQSFNKEQFSRSLIVRVVILITRRVGLPVLKFAPQLYYLYKKI